MVRPFYPINHEKVDMIGHARAGKLSLGNGDGDRPGTQPEGIVRKRACYKTNCEIYLVDTLANQRFPGFDLYVQYDQAAHLA
jgi:hypothetical protein